MAELTLAKKNDLEDYKCPANDAITFKFVSKPEDIDDEGNGFKPDMTHQIFGDSEMIFGYKGLKVSIFNSAAKLVTYFNVSYQQQCDVNLCDVPPDDVEKVLKEELPHGYLTNLDEFRASLERESNFKPFGRKIDEYCVETKTGAKRQFEVYYTKIEEPGFRSYHEHLQMYIKFYIDAASYIDADDELWDFFLLFEKYEVDGASRYAIAGYMTVYNFYAYPSQVRPRISQVLVLPPFQKMGLGAKMIQTFYNLCYSRSDVLDITVEDPSENFQRVRDFVDCTNCQKLDNFQPEVLRKGFSKEMSHEAQRKLKLSKLQTRRVYEILRLKATDECNKEMFRAFRLDVKKRLNIPFLKNRRTYQKLEKSLSAEELAQTLGVMKDEQKWQYLEQAFQECYTDYKHVLERLAAS